MMDLPITFANYYDVDGPPWLPAHTLSEIRTRFRNEFKNARKNNLNSSDAKSFNINFFVYIEELFQIENSDCNRARRRRANDTHNDGDGSVSLNIDNAKQKL